MILLYTVMILIHSCVLKCYNLRILENNANQIEMRPKRDSSNVSNFFLIIGQLRYHFPKTNENTILGKLLRKAKGSES